MRFISRLISIFKRSESAKLLSDSSLLRLSLYHNKRGPVWADFKTLTDALQKHKISYAVIGGLAVYAHGFERLTNDCDILLSKEVSDHFFISVYFFHFFSYLGLQTISGIFCWALCQTKIRWC